MSGVLLDSRDVPILRELIRAYRNGALGGRTSPAAGGVTTNPAIVALLIQTTDVRGTGTLISPTAVASLNYNSIANEAVALEPVNERVTWIRVLGGEYPPASPHPPAIFQLRAWNGSIATFTIEDTPDEVREKLIGMGLPDTIEVRGRGNQFNDERFVWNQFVAWAVKFPNSQLNQTASNPFPLEWYEDPQPTGGAIRATARIDDYPYWPRLDRPVFIWKAIPSSDVVPAGSFVHASWLWGRGYVADQWECVL